MRGRGLNGEDVSEKKAREAIAAMLSMEGDDIKIADKPKQQ